MRSGKVYWLVLIVIILILLAFTALYFFDPNSRLQGTLRGDPWYHDRPAVAWENELRAGDDNTRSLAAEQLRAGGAESLPVLVVLLKSPDTEPRLRAAGVLGQIGPAARPAGPDLIAALNDPDPLVRKVAAQSLGKLAPDVPGAVAALMERFPDIAAIRAVAEYKSAGAPAVPKLTELLTDADAEARWNAARTLGRIGEPVKSAIPGLVKQLTDSDALVREHAAEALGDIGPVAASTVPDLVKVLHDPEWKVRRDAVRSLGQMGGAAKSALSDVKALQSDPQAQVKDAAKKAERLISDPSPNPGQRRPGANGPRD